MLTALLERLTVLASECEAACVGFCHRLLLDDWHKLYIRANMDMLGT